MNVNLLKSTAKGRTFFSFHFIFFFIKNNQSKLICQKLRKDIQVFFLVTTPLSSFLVVEKKAEIFHFGAIR